MNEHQFNRIFWGLILLGIGAVLLLRQTGIIDIDIGSIAGTFWPVILIGIGLQNILIRRFYGGGTGWWGIFMVVLGGFFLGRNLGVVDMDLGEIIRYGWPVVLIIIGLNMMFKPNRRAKKHDDGWKSYSPRPEEQPYDRPVPPAPPLHPNPLDLDYEKPAGGADPSNGAGSAQDIGPSPGGGAGGQSGYGGHGGAGGQGGFGAQGGAGAYGGHSDYAGHKHHHHKHERVEWWNHEPGVQTRSGFIGDIHLGGDYWELKPMNIAHFIGDTTLDLTKAQIPLGETRITISSFIGDVKVFIPNDYEIGVHVATTAFLGDAAVLERREGGMFKNINVETPYYHETDKKIKLVVSTFIGDVRVTKVG